MARNGVSPGLLAGIPLFSACTRAQLRTIASLVEVRSVEEGDVVTSEGRRGREFFVIAEGRARVTLNRRRLADLGPGDFFGEMALLDQGPRAATVTAATPMRLYVVDAPAFTELLDSSPDVGRRILRGVAERLRAAHGRRLSPHA